MHISLELLGLVLAAVVAIVSAVWWMINRVFKKGSESHKLDYTHDKVKEYEKKSVECEKRFVQLEERKTDNKAIEGIRMDLFRMAEKLDLVLSGAGDLVQSHSPIALTQTGRDIAAEMEMEERITNNWRKIHELLDSDLESKNPYDIQQFCLGIASAYPERFFSNEDIEFFKNYAYGKGKPLAYYGSMIGVMIRDAYFKHKGIDVAEIDEHDQSKES